jgi:4-hydroxy-tetrahydrodipicolinate synthase
VVPFLVQGGVGCISVTANIAPRLCAGLHKAWAAGDMAKVREINEKLLPVHDSMFVETNPAPVKYAASLLGLCTGELRLPMCEVTDASKARIEAAMAGAGLLK